MPGRVFQPVFDIDTKLPVVGSVCFRVDYPHDLDEAGPFRSQLYDLRHDDCDGGPLIIDLGAN